MFTSLGLLNKPYFLDTVALLVRDSRSAIGENKGREKENILGEGGEEGSLQINTGKQQTVKNLTPSPSPSPCSVCKGLSPRLKSFRG